MAIDLATDEERMKFKRKWERAEMASYLRMASMQTENTKPVIDLVLGYKRTHMHNPELTTQRL